MPTEQIVVSLEWAKKLKEAGWPQENACFYFKEYDESKETEKAEYLRSIHRDAMPFIDARFANVIRDKPYYILYAALTAEELLGKLPKEYKDAALTITWDDSRWCVGYYPFGSKDPFWESFIHQGCLPDSLACLYCYLSEQKLL